MGGFNTWEYKCDDHPGEPITGHIATVEGDYRRVCAKCPRPDMKKLVADIEEARKRRAIERAARIARIPFVEFEDAARKFVEACQNQYIGAVEEFQRRFAEINKGKEEDP